MDIDVIIPLHQGERWILETLDSVAAQTKKPRKVLVVDDASRDRSRLRVERTPGVTYIANPNPGSAVAARNCGLAHADSELVAFLDQDDLWHPDHLDRMSQVFEQDPEVQGASARPNHFRDGDPVRFDTAVDGAERFDPWDLYPFSVGHDPSLVVCRRKVFDQFSWPLEHVGMADISVWLRMALEGPLVRSRAATVARRWHPQSMYAVQRRKDPGALLRVYRRVADDRLADFKKLRKNDPRLPQLERRRQIIHRMSGIVDSLIEQSSTRLVAEFTALDALLAGEEEEFRQRPYNHLIPVFAAMVEVNGKALPAARIFELLLDCCNADAPVGQPLVRDWVIRMMPGVRVAARHVMAAPWSARRIGFAGTLLARRVTRPAVKTPATTRKAATGRTAAPVEFVTQFGSGVAADGRFLHVEDLALDSRNRLLATDAYLSVVEVFSLSGEFLGSFGGVGSGGQGLFDEPEGIAVAPNGDVYVSDSESGLIQVFDSDHRFRLQFGGRGSGDGQTRHSEFMGFGPDGLLYLADGFNNRICVFDAQGRLVRALCSNGSAPGELEFPQGCKVDRQGRVWVSDLKNHRIQVLDAFGKPLLCFGSKGTGPGEFHSPSGLALDEAGNVYVCDMENHRVQSFDSEGRFRFEFGEHGSGPGQLNHMLGILISPDNHIFISDTGNGRIQKFRILA